MLILITGCAGFIGSHLTQKLLEQKHTIIGIDNLITGSKDNIQHLFSNHKFTFIEHDITQPLPYNLINNEIHQIYHLASIASPYHYFKFSLETIHTNIYGLDNILQLAVKNNCSILYTSTSEVYGDPQVNPQPETYFGNVNCYGPRACYDESKRVGETMVYEFKRKYNLDTKIVRIFNTYGPNMNLEDKRVVIEFIKQAVLNEPLIVNGDGQQTRSFTYVDDTVDGLIKLMNSNEHGPINIGNPNTEYTINDLAQIVISLTNSTSDIIHNEKLENDPTVRRPDITLAQQKLDWAPSINLESGLQSTIEYVKHKLNL